jgi:Zn-dependent peptidase ImmA (M78 family)/DNA-binding XRE family transcriptional regulator
VSTVPAYVSPTVLAWARKRTGASIEATADKVNIKPEKLTAWEQGKEYPSMRQAQHLAAALHVPFGYLFLSAPPEEPPPIPDFRTKRSTTLRHLSPDLLDVIYDVLLKQEWYREFLEQEGNTKLPFVGQFSLKSEPTDIAVDITQRLDISEELRKHSGSWEDFLRILVNKAEQIGILVLRSGIVGSNSHRALSPEEFRGFTISDDLAPVVFINSADARAAQIFTFAHELAHVWLGESGISNEELRDVSASTSDIEDLCNTVAAEVLVPSELFLARWQKSVSIDDNLAALKTHFKVSSLVLLRRAFDLEEITKAAYINHYEAEIRKYSQRDVETSGGNFFNNFFARNGAPFAHAVIGAVTEGKTNYREAARLLNIKVPTIHKIAEQLNLKKADLR